MPISDLDINQTAQVLIDKHGEGAVLEAMKRLEQFNTIGNESGKRLWGRIADAIEWLQLSPNLTDEIAH